MKEGNPKGRNINPETDTPKKHRLVNTARVAMATGLIAIPAWACNQSEDTLFEPTPITRTGTPMPEATQVLRLTPTAVPSTVSPTETLTKPSPTVEPTPTLTLFRTKAPEPTSMQNPSAEYGYEENKATSTEEKILALEVAIENQFNINLTTVNDVYGSKSLRSAKPEDMVVWNLDRLGLLEKSLSALPEHFYEPSKTGDKLSISLDLGDRANCSCWYEEVLPYRINIGIKHFESVEELLSTLTHEFVHLVMPIEIPMAGSRRDTSKIGELDSPWYRRIDQILGKKFEIVRPELASMAKRKVDPDRMTIAMYGGMRRNFYEKFLYGVEGHTMAAYGYRLPNEFIPVLGETYLEGTDRFYLMYGEFFPQDTVEQLYNFVKENIFKGMEFEGSK